MKIHLHKVLLSTWQIGTDIKGCKWENLGSIGCVVNVQKSSNMNRYAERNKSQLIKISTLLVFQPKLERDNFTMLHQYMREIEGRVFFHSSRIYCSYASSVGCSGGCKSADWSDCRGQRDPKTLSLSKSSAKLKTCLVWVIVVAILLLPVFLYPQT